MSSVKKSTFDSEEKNRIEKGTLYLVATPIGNLADLSDRAKKVLSEVDFIAAEDTRNSGHLLMYLGIQKNLISYFEHNKRERGEQIAARLEAGESCALITDAGTPAISDPGEDMVRLCAERGVPVTSVPGPVASVTALTLSALSTGRFCFEGFLSVRKNERHAHLEQLKQETRTMLFHEAPHKLRTTLQDLSDTFGAERKIAVCRELTKKNEEVLRMTLGQAIAHYETVSPRGEYVLVVEGACKAAPQSVFWQDLDILDHVRFYLEQGSSKMDAVKQTAKDRGISKNEVYRECICLSEK